MPLLYQDRLSPDLTRFSGVWITARLAFIPGRIVGTGQS